MAVAMPCSLLAAHFFPTHITWVNAAAQLVVRVCCSAVWPVSNHHAALPSPIIVHLLVVVQLREELSNARGINDFTADETTKLLLDNSRLHQGFLAARSEVLHKDEMLRLLSAEVK